LIGRKKTKAIAWGKGIQQEVGGFGGCHFGLPFLSARKEKVLVKEMGGMARE